MITLLDTDDLPCLNEEQVLHATLRWIKHDIFNRKTHTFDILGTVRFQSLTLKDFENSFNILGNITDSSFAVALASIKRDLQFNRLSTYVS